MIYQNETGDTNSIYWIMSSIEITLLGKRGLISLPLFGIVHILVTFQVDNRIPLKPVVGAYIA